MSRVGDPKGLSFDLRWSAPRAAGSAAEATRGEITVWLDDRIVWGARRARTTVGFPWTFVDVLEHLSRRWPAILWEEMDPFGLAAKPWDVRNALHERFLVNLVEREAAERALLRYEESHNLAAAFAGAAVAPLWVQREGLRALMSGGKRPVYQPFPEVQSTLTALGDQIADRLKTNADPRAAEAITTWRDRGKLDPVRQIILATALTRETVTEIAGNEDAAARFGVRAGDDTAREQLVAARMLSGKSAGIVRDVVDWIAKLDGRPASALDAMNERGLLAEKEAGPRAPAHLVGRSVATWFRSVPGIASSSGRVEPADVLRQYGVKIAERELDATDIDAVCCWGRDRGPAILLNTRGVHAQGEEGRRATLAHELCHLLVDRHRSLPVAEVLGGRCVREVEQKANAFAAEFLLPSEVAGDDLAGRGVDARSRVRALKQRYGASGAIIAWQAVRSSRRSALNKATRDYLSTLVPQDERALFVDTSAR